MKRLFLLLVILSALVLPSCTPVNKGTGSSDTPAKEEIIVPPLTNFDREKVNFSETEYSRPDTAHILEKIRDLSQAVNAAEIEYSPLVDNILEIDLMYADFDTMTALLMLKTSADITDSALAYEYELLTGAAPEIDRALEELFAVLYNSEFKTRLESEIFGEGFLEKYKNGSKYNDQAVALLEREADLEAEYFALSPATVKITFEGKTDTYENTLKRVKSIYASNPIRLRLSLSRCEELFYSELDKKSCQIFTELLKLRHTLAEAFGYNSYKEYAYEMLGHDYSEEQTDSLLEAISEYAVPVYSALSRQAFAGFFKTHSAPKLDNGKAINNTYTALTRLDRDIAAVYSYMLNCGLYDISPYTQDRRGASFTIYLENNDIPFVFATTEGKISDYTTILHEFGHFYDDTVNYGTTNSLDTAEVSSQALELLALTELRGFLTNNEYKYLYYSEMKSMLEVLIFQGFYAKFESLAYDLPYEDITMERLDGLVREAAAFMKLNTAQLDSLSDVVILHLIDTPFYVQSYCTSLVAALDIFFTECENDGAGVIVYKEFVSREDDEGFTEALERSGVPSPFRDGALTEILDKIYFSIIGSHYFGVAGDTENAA